MDSLFDKNIIEVLECMKINPDYTSDITMEHIIGSYLVLILCCKMR